MKENKKPKIPIDVELEILLDQTAEGLRFIKLLLEEEIKNL